VAGDDRLYGIARAMLDCVAGALTAPPERRYVSDGPLVAWDCEQLVAAVERTISTSGNAAVEVQDPSLAFVMRSATVGLWLVRCCPTMDDDGTAPTAEAVDASAQVVLRDPTVMVRALWSAQQAGTIGGCRSMAFLGWQAVGPSGGLTGGVLRMAVDLTSV
jgi:hypothetical protein